jgi:hypothetical protein
MSKKKKKKKRFWRKILIIEEKGKNWTFELWVFFFQFLVIGRAKAADGCFIRLFCSVGYSESVGKHFESWAFDFSRAEAAKLP